jgi:hypothetical protein
MPYVRAVSYFLWSSLRYSCFTAGAFMPRVEAEEVEEVGEEVGVHAKDALYLAFDK